MFVQCFSLSPGVKAHGFLLRRRQAMGALIPGGNLTLPRPVKRERGHAFCCPASSFRSGCLQRVAVKPVYGGVLKGGTATAADPIPERKLRSSSARFGTGRHKLNPASLRAVIMAQKKCKSKCN